MSSATTSQQSQTASLMKSVTESALIMYCRSSLVSIPSSYQSILRNYLSTPNNCPYTASKLAYCLKLIAFLAKPTLFSPASSAILQAPTMRFPIGFLPTQEPEEDPDQ